MTNKYPLVLCLAIAVALVPVSALAQRGRTVNIAVITDGASQRNTDFFESFGREIVDLLSIDYTVNFVEGGPIAGDTTYEGVRDVIDRALADSGVDLVLTAGPIASNYVGHMESLPKPVVALFVMNAQIQGFPYADGTSGRRNLNYITFTLDLAGAIEAFREVVSFERLGFLMSEGAYDASPELLEVLSPWFVEQGIDLQLVPVGMSADDVLAQLAPDREAVMVANVNQLSDAEFGRLAEGLIERGLPSFSLVGEMDVETGLMMTTYRSADMVRLARRTALNIQRILDGENASRLPVNFSRDEALLINMATARAIGVSPGWAILTEAQLLHPQRLDAERLTLEDAVALATEANLSLVVESYRVAASQAQIDLNRSPLLPQSDISLGARLIDTDRARVARGQNPQFMFNASLGLTQMIYTEGAWAGFQISEYLYASDLEVQEQIRLDIVAETAIAYLDVLRYLAIERIEQENLAVTRTNLELARVREAVGFSGPSDVFRFESEIAQNRQRVIDASALRNAAEIQLNVLLNRPAEASFSVEEPDTLAAVLGADARIRPYLDNPANFSIYRDFTVEETLAHSPELRQIEALIEAREREMTAAERSFWAPDVFLDGDLTYWIGAGVGDEFIEIPGFATSIDSWNWTVGLYAALPLLTGGERRAQTRVVDQQLAELSAERARVAQQLEQSSRTALHFAGSSAAGIRLSEAAAEASQSNLELVMDSYARGVASIPELIDAQAAAQNAYESAANAVYDFLIDQTRAQRARGYYLWELDDEEIEAFFERLEAYFEAARQQQ